MGTPCGSTTHAGTPTSRAANATPWPWFPADAVMTPPAREAVSSWRIAFSAPRILNAPVCWRFSSFRNTSRPASCESASERSVGVCRTCGAMRAAAARTAAASSASATMVTLCLRHAIECAAEPAHGLVDAVGRPRDDPAHAQPGKEGLRERAHGHDIGADRERLDRCDVLAAVAEQSVRIVLDDHRSAGSREGTERFAPAFGERLAGGILEVRDDEEE